MEKKELFYIVIIIALVIALSYVLFFRIETEKCIANTFNLTQLETMNKTITDIKKFCSQGRNAFSCINKVYYVYKESNTLSNTSKKWLFLETPENVSGMTAHGVVRYVCKWK